MQGTLSSPQDEGGEPALTLPLSVLLSNSHQHPPSPPRLQGGGVLGEEVPAAAEKTAVRRASASPPPPAWPGAGEAHAESAGGEARVARVNRVCAVAPRGWSRIDGMGANSPEMKGGPLLLPLPSSCSLGACLFLTYLLGRIDMESEGLTPQSWREPLSFLCASL